MSKGKNQYVVPTKDGWGVKSEGSKRLTIKTDTKTEVVKIGIIIAKNQHSELTRIIHAKTSCFACMCDWLWEEI